MKMAQIIIKDNEKEYILDTSIHIEELFHQVAFFLEQLKKYDRIKLIGFKDEDDKNGN